MNEGDMEETEKINVVPLADLTLVLLHHPDGPFPHDQPIHDPGGHASGGIRRRGGTRGKCGRKNSASHFDQ
jgi:hypothetical protein